jgi:hypothetical protein
MSLTLEFHDSEILDVVSNGDRLAVRFSAASARRDGRERGWLRGVTLTLSPAAITGDLGQAFGKVTEGWLRQDGQSVGTLSLPVALSGEVALLLRFANGAQVNASGRALAISAGPDAVFFEDLSC